MVTAEDDSRWWCGRWWCGHCGEGWRDEEEMVEHKRLSHPGCNLCIYYIEGYVIRMASKFDRQLSLEMGDHEDQR